MEEKLKARFSSKEIALASSLGVGGESLKAKIEALFGQLTDPLLSAGEVGELLAVAADEAHLIEDLEQLVNEKYLEKSLETTRPLDKEILTLYRRADKIPTRLKVLAIGCRLSDQTYRYLFTIDGRLIRSFSRIDRLDAVAGTGNQRSEVIKHVGEIAKGIKSGTQIANSVLMVFQTDVFITDPDPEETLPASWVICRTLGTETNVPHPLDAGLTIQCVKTVELDIPFRLAAFDEEKSALLVDGQQRTSALSLVDVDEVPSFAFSVSAVVASLDDAKKIFQLANSTVKITTQFSRALLASMEDAPGYLKKRNRQGRKPSNF
jgi:hypothetical protein